MPCPTARALIVLPLLALAAGCQRAAPAPAGPAVVTLTESDLAAVQSTLLVDGPTLSGTLSPRRAGTQRSKVNAEVLQVNVNPGDAVKEGAVLLVLDNRTLQQLANSTRLAVRSARSALDVAQINESRAAKLLQAGAVAAQEVDAARSARLLQQAQLAEAQGRLATVEEQLRSAEIRAPFDGVVSERPVSPGDVVVPGTALVTVIDPASLTLEGSVSAEQVASLKVGAPVQFEVAGYGDRQFRGAVERINPAADPATRQVRLSVALANEGGTLLAGLVAHGRVATQQRRALALPLTAVDTDGPAPEVTRIRAEKTERVRVELGLRDELAERVEVKGLGRGDRVVLNAVAARLPPGTPVRLQLPAPPAQGRRPP